MTQPPALPPEGWYPNPENPEQQRWWDGQQWTEHVAVGAPMAPGYEQLPQPQPYQPQPYQPGAQPQAYQPQSYQPGAQPPDPYQAQPDPYQAQQPYQPQSYQGQPYPGPQPGYQQYPQPGYAPYPASPGQGGYGPYSPATPPKGVLPDGALVAGWWWRVLARVIDGFILLVPTVLIAIPLFRHVVDNFRDYIDQVDAASRAGLPAPEFSSGISGRDLILFGLLAGLIQVGYELVMLKYCSATVGKLACGLRVREWDRRGPLSWSTTGKRVLSFQVATSVPQVGGLYYLVDVLWPLWDGKKQALHDKVASTAVVKKVDAVAAPSMYGGATSFGGYQSF